jgi:hypothetical protein
MQCTGSVPHWKVQHDFASRFTHLAVAANAADCLAAASTRAGSRDLLTFRICRPRCMLKLFDF